jgi:hypothetical protein
VLVSCLLKGRREIRLASQPASSWWSPPRLFAGAPSKIVRRDRHLGVPGLRAAPPGGVRPGGRETLPGRRDTAQEVYDPATNTWSSVAPAGVPRPHPSGVGWGQDLVRGWPGGMAGPRLGPGRQPRPRHQQLHPGGLPCRPLLARQSEPPFWKVRRSDGAVVTVRPLHAHAAPLQGAIVLTAVGLHAYGMEDRAKASGAASCDRTVRE